MDVAGGEHPGLTSAQVAERVASGQLNAAARRSARSAWDIVRSNVFTRFNAIFAVLAAIICYTGY